MKTVVAPYNVELPRNQPERKTHNVKDYNAISRPGLLDTDPFCVEEEEEEKNSQEKKFPLFIWPPSR